ncbi:unnamed protein product [Natator depressus]
MKYSRAYISVSHLIIRAFPAQAVSQVWETLAYMINLSQCITNKALTKNEQFLIFISLTKEQIKCDFLRNFQISDHCLDTKKILSPPLPHMRIFPTFQSEPGACWNRIWGI